MIEVNCPSCGKGYKLADKLAGRRVKCRQCGKPIDVPGAAGDKAKAEPERGGQSKGPDWDLVFGSIAEPGAGEAGTAGQAAVAPGDDPSSRIAPPIARDTTAAPAHLRGTAHAGGAMLPAMDRSAAKGYTLDPTRRSPKTHDLDTTLESHPLVYALAVIGHGSNIAATIWLVARISKHIPEGTWRIWLAVGLDIGMHLAVLIPLLAFAIAIAGRFLKFDAGPTIVRTYALTAIGPLLMSIAIWTDNPDWVSGLMISILVLVPLLFYVLFPLDVVRCIAAIIAAVLVYLVMMSCVAFLLAVTLPKDARKFVMSPGVKPVMNFFVREMDLDAPPRTKQAPAIVRDPPDPHRPSNPPPQLERRQPERLSTVDDAITVLSDPGFEDRFYRDAMDIVRRADPSQLTLAQREQLTPLLQRRLHDPDSAIAAQALEALTQIAPAAADQGLRFQITENAPAPRGWPSASPTRSRVMARPATTWRSC